MVRVNQTMLTAVDIEDFATSVDEGYRTGGRDGLPYKGEIWDAEEADVQRMFDAAMESYNTLSPADGAAKREMMKNAKVFYDWKKNREKIIEEIGPDYVREIEEQLPFPFVKGLDAQGKDIVLTKTGARRNNIVEGSANQANYRSGKDGAGIVLAWAVDMLEGGGDPQRRGAARAGTQSHAQTTA